MHKTILLIEFLFFNLCAQAQYSVEVPSVIHYADMRLELTHEARKKIQTDVDALIRYEKYFVAKVNKVDAYLPLIEQVLREERVPDDIKYLVIQESALVGNAVSSSNAVGYWQFKEASAREVGLTINNEVDERMNIITATHGAARYFKNNNTFFDNWLYALLAYYAGPGGALKIADKKQYGVKEMKLDGNTHWYVIKFLAHKIAFEQAVGKNPKPDMILYSYPQGNGKTLAQVAKEVNLETSDLEPYNKWVRKNRIPEDKEYQVIVPDYSGQRAKSVLADAKPSLPAKTDNKSDQRDEQQAKHSIEVENTQRFPVIRQGSHWGRKVTLINDSPGVVAEAGDNIRSLSQKTNVSPSKLVKYNDLTSKQSGIIANQPYYLKRKNNRALAHYHIVEPGETLRTISQRFGIKLDKLMRNNRMREEQSLKLGLVLWLRYIRPVDIPEEYRSKSGGQPKKEDPRQTPIVASSARQNPKPNTEVADIKKPQPQVIDQPRVRIDEVPVKPVTIATPSSSEAVIDEETQARNTNEIPSPVLEEKEEEPVLIPSVSSQIPTQNPGTAFHMVTSGETLYSIAKLHNLTVPQLTSYNNLSWDASLAVGQKLSLNATDVEQEIILTIPDSDYLVHEVKSGETMYKVARQYEVTIKDLMEWNNKEDFDVSIGEKLKVRKR